MWSHESCSLENLNSSKGICSCICSSFRAVMTSFLVHSSWKVQHSTSTFLFLKVAMMLVSDDLTDLTGILPERTSLKDMLLYYFMLFSFITENVFIWFTFLLLLYSWIGLQVRRSVLLSYRKWKQQNSWGIMILIDVEYCSLNHWKTGFWSKAAFNDWLWMIRCLKKSHEGKRPEMLKGKIRTVYIWSPFNLK